MAGPMIRAIDVARSQLGIHEATGKNDGVPQERYMRGDALAWCAGFVLYCNANSDDENLAATTKEHYAMRSVAGFIAAAKAKGLFLPPTEVPQENDVVFFGDTDSDVGVKGHHVGIVDAVDVARGRFTTVEGNYSNKVASVNHRIGEKQVVGFARPLSLVTG
jgi:hypothetical protein